MGKPSPNLNIKDVFASFFGKQRLRSRAESFSAFMPDFFAEHDLHANTCILLRKSAAPLSCDLQFTTKTVPFATDFPVSGKSVLYLGQSR